MKPKDGRHECDPTTPDIYSLHLFSPFSCLQVELCTEGENRAYAAPQGRSERTPEDVAFSQYPRPADAPQVGSLFQKRGGKSSH